MKVLFVYSNIECSCTRKCCFELSNSLNKYITTKVIYFNKFNRDIIKDYDIIIFQRVGTASNVTEKDKNEILRIIDENRAEKKFVYLIDDLVLNVENKTPIDFIKKCNAVICTSKTLEKYIRVYNEKVYRFHTFIDFDLYESIQSNKYDKFTLAWVSTGGLGKDIIRNIINYRKYIGIDFNLIIIGNQAKEFTGVNNVEAYPIMSEIEMIKKIKGVDILLNPMVVGPELESTINLISNNNISDFINCKSEVKYAIAGAIKACLITSSTENYIKAIKNMENGIIVNDNPGEWIRMIQYLYKSKGVISKIGENAYCNVKDEYTGDAVARQFYETLNKIASSKK